MGNRLNPTAKKATDPYAEFNINHLLTLVFSSYDSDHDGKISMQEFNQLVRDLYEVRDGCVPSNVDDCVKSIAQDIMTATLQPFAASTTVLSDFSLYVNDFVLAAKRRPCPFDDPVTGAKGLSSTLLQKGEIVIKLNQERRSEEEDFDGKRKPFKPSYDWQKIQPWQEPLSWSGLEIQLDSKRARIPESAQAVLMIPALDRPVRIWAKRTDTMRDLYVKICDSWPGREGRGVIKPDPSNIQLMYNSQKLDDESTVEQVGLYFIAKDTSIQINGGKLAGLKSSYHDTQSAAIFDRISTNFTTLQRQLRSDTIAFAAETDGFNLRLQKIYEKVLAEADSIPGRSEIDEVDRIGLKDMAKELRQKIQVLKLSIDSSKEAMSDVTQQSSR